MIEWRPWHVFTNSDKVAPASQEVSMDESALDAGKQDIRAQLSAVTYNSIASELSAKISELPFKEGQAFKVGQVLVVFDCATQQAQYQKTKAVLSIADRNYQTNKKLLALGSVGRIEYENSYSEYLKAKAENDELASVLARCNVLAPYSGLIVEQKVRAQQYVQAGQPLLDILDNSALELEFVAPSKWSPWLTAGYKFEIKLDETGKSYPAKITRVNGKIDPVSQTIKVAAVIDGEFKEIGAGMSGVLVINPPETTSNPDVTNAPSTANSASSNTGNKSTNSK
ncbi:efflux RND transporter periplasmic adaptor subunit [Polynucleobacter sp. AP-Capit-er-40B-B4]|nr:efflux RND transporter periplasmic adaptor subunit [Polynucleobacter sp. AP-Capit-er-40B-B4]